jgi:hypothetical protein
VRIVVLEQAQFEFLVGCVMSTQEIIAELPKLTRPELEQVDAHVRELLCGNRGKRQNSWGEALLELDPALRPARRSLV